MNDIYIIKDILTFFRMSPDEDIKEYVELFLKNQNIIFDIMNDISVCLEKIKNKNEKNIKDKNGSTEKKCLEYDYKYEYKEWDLIRDLNIFLQKLKQGQILWQEKLEKNKKNMELIDVLIEIQKKQDECYNNKDVNMAT